MSMYGIRPHKYPRSASEAELQRQLAHDGLSAWDLGRTVETMAAVMGVSEDQARRAIVETLGLDTGSVLGSERKV